MIGVRVEVRADPVAFRNIKIRALPADGSVPDPVDGELPLKSVEAFPHIEWEDWQGVDELGRVRELRPLVLTHAGNDSGRIFVAAQRGMIHSFPHDPEVRTAKMFLDIRSKVSDWSSPQENNEEGLLGLAFHPRYQENGHFYVYYSSAEETRVSRVSRFAVSRDDPQRADPDSEQILMRIPQTYANHNGGSILFGRDGYLYIGLGDGGGHNDPFGHGQNLSTWLGSVLRIDVDGEQEGLPYAIPPDNPFIDRPASKPEIYAYGLRNVWRLFEDRQTGILWAGDVGQDLWEEINIIRRGGNYGWSGREGLHAFNHRPPSSDDLLMDPVWEYDHQVGKSITGGLVYRGSRLPELSGMYVYADYVSGKIWGLRYDEKTGRVMENLRIPSTGTPVLSFGEDEAGEIYSMTGSASGKCIFRFKREE
jgi:glucose/arabinose dehydrogenase